MKIYIVGGAVRDALLGLPVQDRDHVVVGASAEDLVALGYTPVGRDFPVFLHPVTHEEHALARTERKTAPGYRGFVFHAAPDVTLEQDLVRRDLTINAMAQDEDGALIDPYGGQRDLANRVFRHVGEAFAEDPVRILRVARFAARFTDFTVAPETLALMRSMVAAGEVDALVPERVWQECARGLMEAKPSRMLAVLAECGALERIAPEVIVPPDAAWPLLDRAAAAGLSLAQRFATWMAEGRVAPASMPLLTERLKVPNDCRDLAVLVLREAAAVAELDESDAQADNVLALFERCDTWRRRERFEAALDVLALLEGTAAAQWPPRLYLLSALDAASSVDAGAIARSVAPAQIPQAIRAARLAAITARLR